MKSLYATAGHVNLYDVNFWLKWLKPLAKKIKKNKTQLQISRQSKKLRLTGISLGLVAIFCITYYGVNYLNVTVFLSRILPSQSKTSWLFVDLSNQSPHHVVTDNGQLGLRWTQISTQKLCANTYTQLKHKHFSAHLVSKPKRRGLCRIDIGPFPSMRAVFKARDQLYYAGFNGKLAIVRWLNLNRSRHV